MEHSVLWTGVGAAIVAGIILSSWGENVPEPQDGAEERLDALDQQASLLARQIERWGAVRVLA